jgi:DNA-binding transcriptional LysR family regulator
MSLDHVIGAQGLNETSRFGPAQVFNKKCEIKIVHVRYFLAAFEIRNFTLAAKCCGVSQPTLSIAIRRLERLLGNKLFQRSTSWTARAQPTELAIKAHPLFQAVVNNMDAAIGIAKRHCHSSG